LGNVLGLDYSLTLSTDLAEDERKRIDGLVSAIGLRHEVVHVTEIQW